MPVLLASLVTLWEADLEQVGAILTLLSSLDLLALFRAKSTPVAEL